METTFGIIKPDAVAAEHVGEIISLIERRHDLRIVRLRMHRIGVVEAGRLYVEHHGKHFYDGMIGFMTSGPSVLLALEGEHAITQWRELMGATNPARAAADTIRAQFGSFNAATMFRNAVHGSDSPEAARRELELFFG